MIFGHITPAESFAGGTGSASSPYLIATAEQLSKITYDKKFKNITYLGKHFKLVSDIDLSLKKWDSIPFVMNVTFDGNGYAIKNMDSKSIVSYDDGACYVYNGLFKNAMVLKLSNISLVNAMLQAQTSLISIAILVCCADMQVNQHFQTALQRARHRTVAE